MKTNLIGISGKKGSGKNTVGSLIASAVPYTKLMSFAGPLKVSALRSLGYAVGDEFHYEVLADDLKNTHEIVIRDLVDHNVVKTLTFREYLQWYGTEGHREVFTENFWVDYALSRMEVELQGLTELVVFTDCRFPNEAEAILSKGGVVLEVMRPGIDENDEHASEKQLPSDLISHKIVNDGTIKDLALEVKDFLQDKGFIKEDAS